MQNLEKPGTFILKDQDGAARLGELHTAHGKISTPIFMPVGTVGSVKGIAPDDLESVQAEIILGNTYHLYLRPGDELISRRGGLHEFMAWPKPILTDSGGFQAFSLSELSTFSEEGVKFRSHLDGSKHLFTPESVIKIQKNLNSDIMMVLDECVSPDKSKKYTDDSVDLTTRWAERSRKAYPRGVGDQLLFAIAQGGFHSELRKKSVDQLTSLDFDGFAIGGLSVGEPKDIMHELMAYTAPLLPVGKPRYLMGVGTPLDIVEGIAHGIDMFDCVLPTRNARNGTLYTSVGKINIRRKEYAEADEALDPNCSCYTCRTFSRAYLRHLYHSKELLAYRLNSLHNLQYFLDLVRQAREAISNKNFEKFRRKINSLYPDESDKILGKKS